MGILIILFIFLIFCSIAAKKAYSKAESYLGRNATARLLSPILWIIWLATALCGLAIFLFHSM